MESRFVKFSHNKPSILTSTAMNLGRFLLSVNHEDPEMVIRGLAEFRQQVLEDHLATTGFGYHGRKCGLGIKIEEVLVPESHLAITGLLAEYVMKSPQLEELFVLWNLPNREEHRALCASHMATLALVLHIAKSNTSTCSSVISRILSEHLKSLHSQLASGNTELVHSTLGLLLAMVRTSPQNCKDVFQKLNLSSQTLDSVIQKGKTVNWKCPSHDHVLGTDSRLLVIMIVCIVLRTVDENAVLELFAERSLMRKIMHSIGRDSPDTLQIVLPGVLHALAHNPVMAAHVHDVFDGATVRQLVLLYTRPEDAMQALGHGFALQLVELMKSLQSAGANKRAFRGPQGALSAAASVSRCSSYLAQHLEPHTDIRQQEVLAALLSFQPHMLAKSIASLSALKSWDPVPSAEYLGVVRYLAQLLQSAAVDHKVRAQLRAAFAPAGAAGSAAAVTAASVATSMAIEDAAEEGVGEQRSGDAQQTTQAQQNILSGLLGSWFPPGLTKKDLCKMLSHKELSLQRAGLQLSLALAQRLQRSLREAGISGGGGAGGRGRAGMETSAALEHSVAAAIQSYLPDFQLLVNARSRVVKLMADFNASGPSSAAAAAGPSPADADVPTEEAAAAEDDFDFNIEGADDAAVATVVKAELAKLPAAAESTDSQAGTVFDALYVLLLEIVEVYLDLSPQSIATVKFDLLRLLDELMIWDVAQSDDVARSSVQALNPGTLLAVLRVLRLATERTECRWFGSQEDATKMLINLIVAEDWRKATKRTVLMKLMLLCSNATPTLSESASSSEIAVALAEDVTRRARSLLKLVLLQSGLFVGHGLVDLELASEITAWLDPAALSGEALLVQEVILRLAHHWNTPLSIQAAESVQASYLAAVGAPLAGPESASLVPFSPVLFCAMQLACTNFGVFAALLPKHIRAHLVTEGEASSAVVADPFFDKYNGQFRAVVERTVARVLVSAVRGARSPAGMCAALLSGWQVSQSGVATARGEATGVHKLLTQLQQLLVPQKSKAAVRSLDGLAQECPATYLEVLCAGDAFSRSAKKKTAPASSSEATDSDDCFSVATKCAALVTRWACFGAVLDHPSAAAVVAFADENWSLLYQLVLRDTEKAAQCMSERHLEWAECAWQRDVQAAHGVQAKALLLQQAIHFLNLVHPVTAARFVWSAERGLQLAPEDKASKRESFSSTTPMRSSRKRTQSDLSQSSEHGTSFAALALPFCQTVAAGAVALLHSVANAAVVPQVVFADTMLAQLSTTTWLGGWVRTVMGSLVAARQITSARSASRAGGASVARSGEGVEGVWSHLAAALVRTSLRLGDATQSNELVTMAGSLVKIVDCPELRCLLVEQALPAERLSHSDTLKSVPAHSSDAPSLATLDPVVEDAIRAASLSQLAGAVESSSTAQASPLTCALFRYGNKGPAAYYMDLRSLRATSGDSVGDVVKLKEAIRSLQSLASKPLGARGKDSCAQTLLRIFTSALRSMERGTNATAVAVVAREDKEPHGALLELCEAVAAQSDAALHLGTLAHLIRTANTGSIEPSTVLSAVQQCLGSSSAVASRSVETSALFCAALCEHFAVAVDACLVALTAAANPDLTQAARNVEAGRLAEHLAALGALVEDPSFTSGRAGLSSCSSLSPGQGAQVKKKLNKLVKSAVKNGLEIAVVLQWLRRMLVALEANTSSLLGSALQPGEDDFYRSATLFELIPTHSKFAFILASLKDGTHPAKEHLLALVLHLTLKNTVKAANKSKSGKRKHREDAQHPPERFLLADSLLAGYGGSLSAADRISLRVLTALRRADLCPALCTLQPRAVSGVVTAEGLRAAGDLLEESAKWMVEGVTPPMAYNTLGKFPLWRTIEPQPIAFLEEVGDADGCLVLSTAAVEAEWKASKKDGNAKSPTDEEDERNATEEDEVQAVDLLQHCSDRALDPAFYLPAFLHVLRNREVSVRQMANSGALSLTIACLGSPCAALRTCALACLQFAENMLEQQTPTRDAAFRERAQLGLLLTYMRNSFELGEKSATAAPRLPLTTAVFLGRAAMNLMQPSHELFSRVNKYLLCRPYCDVKDVPLYDLLLVNGDAQSDQMQRLAALRLFRDGLQTKQDHLNLCRKNAYNRLMLLFPLIAKDVRAGHAVLDLLDRGLGLRFSARYLLERCLLTSWIKLLAAPMGAMQMHATVNVTAGCDAVVAVKSSALDADPSSSSSSSGGLAHYSKYLVRALTILRRVVASSYLLAVEDASCASHLQCVHAALAAVAWDASLAVQSGYADSIPAEYFVQLVLCMWDLTSALSKTQQASVAGSIVWRDDLLWALSEAVDVKVASQGAGRTAGLNRDELQVSLLCLAGSKMQQQQAQCALLRSKLSQRLRHASYAVLFTTGESRGSASETALAITSAAASSKPAHAASSGRDLAPHAVLDRLTALPHYSSACDYHAAAMEAASIGEAGPPQRMDLAWSCTSSADLSQMTALPGSLGRPFLAALVSSALASMAPPTASTTEVAQEEALDALRWVLIVRSGYGIGAEDRRESVFSATASPSVLSASNIAARLLAEAGLTPSLGGTMCWLQVAGCAVVAARAALVTKHPAASDVAVKLTEALQNLPVLDGEGSRQLADLSDALFEYLSLLVTLHDHPAARGAEHASLRAGLNAKAARVVALCAQGVSVKARAAASYCSTTQSMLDFVRSASTSEYRSVPGLTLLDAAAICLPRESAHRLSTRAASAGGKHAERQHLVGADAELGYEDMDLQSDAEGGDGDGDEQSLGFSAYASADDGGDDDEDEDEESEEEDEVSQEDGDGDGESGMDE